MSDAPRDARSFEVLNPEDFRHLAEIATAGFAEICTPPRQATPAFAGRLRLLCLAQGAARHWRQCEEGIPLELQRGVHDFDVWGFFESLPNQKFPDRPYWSKDFGPSRFGRSPGDTCRLGRKVDLMGRSVEIGPGGPVTAALQWLNGHNRSPSSLRRRPVIVISPGPDFGRMIWPGTLALDLPPEDG